MSIGYKILEQIRMGGLLEIQDCDGPIDRPLIFIWSASADEQLEALVEEYVKKRIEDEREAWDSMHDLPGGEA